MAPSKDLARLASPERVLLLMLPGRETLLLLPGRTNSGIVPGRSSLQDGKTNHRSLSTWQYVW